MSMPYPNNSDWQVTSVPRAWHDAHPKALRPRLKVFWDVYSISFLVLLLGSSVVIAVSILGLVITTGIGATSLSLGLGILFAAVTWFLVSRSILYRGTPVLLGVAAIAWGSTAGVVLGGFTSSAHLSELAVGWGTPEIAWSLAGAWPEETAKALGVVLLLFAGRTWWNRPWHGLIAGMLIGIGFEAFENALYASGFATLHASSDISGVLEMWGLRIVAGPLLHALCTGLAGYAIGIALLRQGLSWQRRIGWACGGWAAGFSVHALWNLAPDWEVDVPQLALVRMVLVWGTGALVLLLAIIRCSREARAAADAWLYPVVTTYHKPASAHVPLVVPGASGISTPGSYPSLPGVSGDQGLFHPPQYQQQPPLHHLPGLPNYPIVPPGEPGGPGRPRAAEGPGDSASGTQPPTPPNPPGE